MKSLIIVLLFIPFLIFSQYYTGQRVFSNKFMSEIKYLNQDTYIKIENSNRDIIVAVKDLIKGRVIQHAYINAEENYSFKNIPIGKYVCLYMYTDKLGKRHYSKDDKTLDFPADQIGGYVITMEVSSEGNLTQSDINENYFFN